MTETPIRTRIRHTTTREQRIGIIARRMRDGTWQRGSSTAELAQEWGVPQHTAEQAASEAATVLRLAVKLLTEDTRGVILSQFAAFLKSA